MIVCLCHRVSDRDIRRSVDAGVRNFDVLQDETRVASACGCCHDCARDVFDEAMAKAGAACPGLCHIDNAASTGYPTITLARI
jgi:bacterioferritin-associated ferredoxin